eukprot:3996580-Alexandrium_andersonii.AAC.1
MASSTRSRRRRPRAAAPLSSLAQMPSLTSRVPIAKDSADCGLADCGLEFANSRPRTPSIHIFVGRFGSCARDGAE